MMFGVLFFFALIFVLQFHFILNFILRSHLPIKSNLHPRSKHRERYDFVALIASCASLKSFVQVNQFGDESINFSNPLAVKILNQALLKHFYGIEYWDIPADFLTPPIPGRADYVHYLADLVSVELPAKINKIRCLDIGVGANCIYPIIGVQEYNWEFVGAEIEPKALEAAQKIVDSNEVLRGNIELRHQTNVKSIFKGIINPKDRFDVTICNPPFHASKEDAESGTKRKIKNLTSQKNSKPILNFGGQSNELWCEGGEASFIHQMIQESVLFSQNCAWFSTLVSKKENLRGIVKSLQKLPVTKYQIFDMQQGNKTSRFIAWSFLSEKELKNWGK
jgi:23S rRNA (adenine1618-N6)-methyltransferase